MHRRGFIIDRWRERRAQGRSTRRFQRVAGEMSAMIEGGRELERTTASEYAAELAGLSRLPTRLDELRAETAACAVRLMMAGASLEDVARAAQEPRFVIHKWLVSAGRSEAFRASEYGCPECGALGSDAVGHFLVNGRCQDCGSYAVPSAYERPPAQKVSAQADSDWTPNSPILDWLRRPPMHDGRERPTTAGFEADLDDLARLASDRRDLWEHTVGTAARLVDNGVGLDDISLAAGITRAEVWSWLIDASNLGKAARATAASTGARERRKEDPAQIRRRERDRDGVTVRTARLDSPDL